MGTRRAGATAAAADARLPVKKRKGGGRRGRRVPDAENEDECPRLLRQTRVGHCWCRRASTAAGDVCRLRLGHNRGEYTTRAHPRRLLGESAQRVELARPCRGTPAAPAAARGRRQLAGQPSRCPPHPLPVYAAPAAAGPSATTGSSRWARPPSAVARGRGRPRVMDAPPREDGIVRFTLAVAVAADSRHQCPPPLPRRRCGWTRSRARPHWRPPPPPPRPPPPPLTRQPRSLHPPTPPPLTPAPLPRHRRPPPSPPRADTVRPGAALAGRRGLWRRPPPPPPPPSDRPAGGRSGLPLRRRLASPRPPPSSSSSDRPAAPDGRSGLPLRRRRSGRPRTPPPSSRAPAARPAGLSLRLRCRSYRRRRPRPPPPATPPPPPPPRPPSLSLAL